MDRKGLSLDGLGDLVFQQWTLCQVFLLKDSFYLFASSLSLPLHDAFWRVSTPPDRTSDHP